MKYINKLKDFISSIIEIDDDGYFVRLLFYLARLYNYTQLTWRI